MARNVIESDIRTSKMAADGHDGHFVKNFKSSISIWNGQKCDRKWISDIQNGRRRSFCQTFYFKSSVSIWNGQKCDRKWISIAFLAILSYISTKTNFCIYLKWPEMRSKVIFGHPKWLPVVILWKKIKLWYRSEMVRKNIYKKSDFNNVLIDC